MIIETGSLLQTNRLKFITAGKLPVVLEGFIVYTPI